MSGLQAGKYLKQNGIKNFIILEKRSEVIRNNSWKTFKHTIDRFDLADCVFQDLDQIHFRTFNLEELEVLTDEIQDIKCYVLDSRRVYQKMLDYVGDNLKTNEEVVDIIDWSKSDIHSKDDSGFQFLVKTSAGHEYDADILIDASGPFSVTEKLVFNNQFTQKAWYTCYSKRYTGCNVEPIKNSATFDFDQPFECAGCWVYPIDENTAEIGVARFSSEKELANPQQVEKIENLLERYKKLSPYNEVFQDASEIDLATGYTPLVPKIDIMKNNIYFIGDSKGAVPWSGYGIDNALNSAVECVDSIIRGKKYKYYVAPPSKGLGILRILWSLGEKFRLAATGISMLNRKEVFKFYTGKIDLSFFFHCAKISRSQNINTLELIPISLLLRLLFGLKPTQKHLNFVKAN